jgi:hypothetical protein
MPFGHRPIRLRQVVIGISSVREKRNSLIVWKVAGAIVKGEENLSKTSEHTMREKGRSSENSHGGPRPSLLVYVLTLMYQRFVVSIPSLKGWGSQPR